jgi:predicted naringenin-chalcone synthase
VPGQLCQSLGGIWEQLGGGTPAPSVPLWAVHPGGRTILDAAQQALGLPDPLLQASRQVLDDFGNMSSATIMFVLQKLMQVAVSGQPGCALAFGPGLTAETLLFRAV